MKLRLFALIAAAAVSMLVFGQNSDSKTKAVLKLLEDWDNAYIKKDARPLEKMLADDYIGIDEDGDVTHKADEIALIKSGEYIIHSVKYIDAPVVRLYGSTAIVTTFASVKQTYKGETTEFKARATTVCAEKDGRWIVVSWHGSKVNRP